MLLRLLFMKAYTLKPPFAPAWWKVASRRTGRDRRDAGRRGRAAGNLF